MSTKIYDAYKVGTTDLNKIWEALVKLRVAYCKHKIDSILERVKEDANFIGLSFALAGISPTEPGGKSFLDIEKLCDEAKEKNSWSEFNLHASTVLYTHPQVGMVLQFFGVPGKLLEPIKESLNLVDYHYQNQTDQPEDIFDEKWDQRRKDWDLLLPDIGIPRENGFVFDFDTFTLKYDVAKAISSYLRSVDTVKDQK